MPVYLVHGFRWPRVGLSGIRVFIVIHNLEDAAAEYLQNPTSSRLVIDAFKKVAPEAMARLPDLRLIEQYDPEDLSDAAVSQPYAYVAGKVLTLPENGIGFDVDELKNQHSELSSALEDLRDKVAPDEKVGWWVVYNGDPERRYPGMDEEYSDDESIGVESEGAEPSEEPKEQGPKKSEKWKRLFGKRA
ncbi:hypothetical protein VTN00DRAFT_9384 [Thermoascus crustaceus]|uniref:uncharacterized protein n=1 Tax=Thermoascus crustaceus TaxID=5088 RepID=UPI003742A16F